MLIKVRVDSKTWGEKTKMEVACTIKKIARELANSINSDPNKFESYK